MTQEISTTPGPWISTPHNLYGYQINSQSSDADGELVAMVKNPANAALIAAAPEMLDALIAIQETMMSGADIDREAIAMMISDVFAKLANEAGEEL